MKKVVVFNLDRVLDTSKWDMGDYCGVISINCPVEAYHEEPVLNLAKPVNRERLQKEQQARGILAKVPNALFLDFVDCIDFEGRKYAPKPHHVDEAMVFVEGLDGWETKPLLVHCQAGQSRSVAISLCVLCWAYPEIPIQQLYQENMTVLNEGQKIIPNASICQYGSERLGRRDLLDFALSAWEHSS